MEENSELIGHEGCANCGSSDANAFYTDGHHYCFSCNTYTPPEGEDMQNVVRITDYNDTFLRPEPVALNKRKITEKTARHWGYGVADYHGKTVQVASYYNKDGEIVAQKLRFANKDFSVLGNLKEAGLYGQHLCRDGGKMITIVEGEVDALSLSQTFDNKYSVVSVPNGAAGAKKAVANAIEWLCKYDSIILMFDQDEVGQAAARECANILPPNKAKIATLPLKDANEMLQAGRSE